jgi:hypothetical protein
MTERELNLRVHRDVMGGQMLSVDEMRGAWECGCEVQYVGRERIEFTVIPHRIVGGEPEFIQDVPDYAGSIADAWRVLANIDARGWKYDVQNRATGHGVHIHFPAPRYASVFVVAESAPLAICKAALEAVNDSAARS